MSHLKNVAKELQKDCHKTVENIVLKNPNAKYQDCTNVWVFKKLAEYEIRLQEIESLLQIK